MFLDKRLKRITIDNLRNMKYILKVDKRYFYPFEITKGLSELINLVMNMRCNGMVEIHSYLIRDLKLNQVNKIKIFY